MRCWQKNICRSCGKMNERAAADGQKNRIIHSQIRNKFKKLVYECKSVSLSQRIASGINEKWWDIFFSFPLLASGDLHTIRISLCHHYAMTVNILIPKPIWEVLRMQQQIAKVNVTQNKKRSYWKVFTNFNKIIYW